MALPTSSVKAVPKLTTTVAAPSQAPVVALTSPSTTQVPVCVLHSNVLSAGEEPLYLVKMKDGTCVYLKESLLSQSGGTVQV
jgi:hypothetical protein